MVRMEKVLAVGFGLAALVQLNDPDPWIWVAMYGGAGLTCLIYKKTRPPWLLPLLIAGAAGFWAIGLAPQALPGFELTNLAREMKAGSPEVELGRELVGLLAIVVCMGGLTVRASRPPRAP